MARIEVPIKYSFPLFTKLNSTDYLIKNDQIRVSDIWSFWEYLIKRYEKKYSGGKAFLQTLLEQAKYFYHAAENAPIKSQPLLYYYSFLNFVKVIINVYSLNLYGSTIEYKHGVESCKVQKENSLKDLNIKIKALGGNVLSVDYTFMKLMGDQITAPPPYQIRIEDMLKSCIGIHRTYCETYNCKETYYKVNNLRLFREGPNLISQYTIANCDNQIQADLKASGYEVASVKDENDNEIYFWHESISMNHYYKPTKLDYYNLANKIRGKGVWYFTDGDKYRTYISTKPLHISTESIIYNLMFFFGSITRYYPYMFDNLMSEQQMWLISEFLRTQPMQFLYIVTSKTIESAILKPKTANLLY